MPSSCRFCAEPMPDGSKADDRCPSCGERLDAADGPPPTPTAVILTTLLGVGYLALGTCCGLSTALNGVSMASMFSGAGGGPGLPMAPFIATLALVCAACVLHAGAGLGLIVRQSAARIPAMVCAVVDLAAGAVLIAAGIVVFFEASARGNSMGGVVLLLEAGLGLALVLTSVAAIVLLRHPMTRAAFAAAPASRAR